ncbi:interaptin-like [Montipora capricornis]|uniref:interaptin-like n=1 Tax=Montipora capricornis TaxID=246305 RepID=UPI0035F13A7F
MTLSPRAKDVFALDNQLGCFPRNDDVARSPPGPSKGRNDGNFATKTSKDIFDDREKELMEIRSYWQEEYKNKANEVAKLEEALKEAIESRKVDVHEMRITYESELSARNNEISELKRTLNDLSGTKEEILASVEKSTESRLRAKDAEITRLRIWLEEAKKSNAQGREMLSSYQKRIADKEAEIEVIKRSSEQEIKALGHKIEKLQVLLSETIADRNKDSENTKVVFDSVVKEKERQIAMLKESSINQLKSKEQENQLKDVQIEEMSSKLLWIESQLTQKWLDEESSGDLKTKLTSLLKKMRALKSEKCFLDKDFVALATDIRAKKGELADVQAKYESESHDKELLQKEFDSLTQDLENWKSATKLIEEERNTLEREAKHLRDQLETKSNSLFELECKFKSVESLRITQEEVIRQLREENTDCFHSQKNLESAIRERDREMNVLKEELKISEKEFALEKEQKEIMDANATTTIGDLRLKYEESQKENEELKTNLDERENDIASLTRLLKDAKQNENNLEAELEQLSQELELLNGKHVREKNEKEAVERSFKHAVTIKEQELEELRQKLEKTNTDQKFEIDRRDKIWREAIKAKDDLVIDVKRSIEERFGWKDAEINKLQKLLEETTVEYRSVKESLEKSLASKMENILQLESNLRRKNEMLTTAEKEIEDLQGRLHQLEDNCAAEIKNILQSTENGFKQREDVAEKLKKIIQENAFKYSQNLQIKHEKISALEKELENSTKDAEDLRVNLASFIQESGENEAKLNRDLGIVQDECRALENNMFEVKKDLDNRRKELEKMEGNMAKAAADFEKKQRSKEEEIEKCEVLLRNERTKVQEFQEKLSYQNVELEQKEQNLSELTEKLEESERKLTEIHNEFSSLRENFQEIQGMLESAEYERVCVMEEKERLLQDIEKQKQTADEKDGRVAVLLHKIKILKKNDFETAKKQEMLEENVATLQMKLNEKDTEIINLKRDYESKKAESEERSLLLEEIRLNQVQLDKMVTELQETVSVQRKEIEGALKREGDLKGAVQDLIASLKEKELNVRALVSKLEDAKSQNDELHSEYENLKTSWVEESRQLNEKIDHLHNELDKQEDILLMANKEKESLLSELGMARQAEENTKTNMNALVKDLENENAIFQRKRSSLDKELEQRSAQIVDLNSALKSAEVSKEFLMKEVESLRISVLEKDESLRGAGKSLVAAEKENNRLHYATEGLENNLARAVDERDNLLKTFEEFRNSASNMKQKLENVLSGKEKTLNSAENVICRLKQDNEALKSQLSRCQRKLDADKKCVVDLLKKEREMCAEIESLSKDKSILEAALKDMDMYPVKLRTTQGERGIHCHIYI